MDLTSYLLGKEAGGGGGTPTLQSKEVEITENGQTTVTADSGYDGLSSVAVTTNVQGGGDLSEYFYDTITSNTYSGSNTGINKLLKKLPSPIIVADNVTSLNNFFENSTLTTMPKIIFNSNVTSVSYMFRSCTNITSVDVSGFDTTNITNFSRMFRDCSNLTTLNLSNFTGKTSINAVDMFSGCSKLTYLDMRNFNFTNISSSLDMFHSVPNNCEIIVKDDTQKTWITTNFSNLTNVKTVAEL